MVEIIKTTKKEQAWINRLEKVLKAMPSTLWLFAGVLSVHVMKLGENGEHIMDGEGVDPEYVLETISGDFDGGDW
jgi:hypothetical protein